MDPVADAYHRLACGLLDRALRDARQEWYPSRTVDARLFLFSPMGEWLIASLGVDPQWMREMCLAAWTQKQPM